MQVNDDTVDSSARHTWPTHFLMTSERLLSAISFCYGCGRTIWWGRIVRLGRAHVDGSSLLMPRGRSVCVSIRAASLSRVGARHCDRLPLFSHESTETSLRIPGKRMRSLTHFLKWRYNFA